MSLGFYRVRRIVGLESGELIEGLVQTIKGPGRGSLVHEPFDPDERCSRKTPSALAVELAFCSAETRDHGVEGDADLSAGLNCGRLTRFDEIQVALHALAIEFKRVFRDLHAGTNGILRPLERLLASCDHGFLRLGGPAQALLNARILGHAVCHLRGCRRSGRHGALNTRVLRDSCRRLGNLGYGALNARVLSDGRGLLSRRLDRLLEARVLCQLCGLLRNVGDGALDARVLRNLLLSLGKGSSDAIFRNSE